MSRRSETKPHQHKPKPRQVTTADLSEEQRAWLWNDMFPELWALKQKALDNMAGIQRPGGAHHSARITLSHD